jgi:hypothetical protein
MAQAPPKRYLAGVPRWLLAVNLGISVAVIIAVLALILDWDTWPGFAAVVLASVAISTSLTVYVGATTRRAARDEADRLATLILARMPSSAEDPHRDAHDQFVSHRFAPNLEAYAAQAPRYGVAFNALSLGSIVAALGSSGLAASAEDRAAAEEVRWIVFGLGLVVAGFTAINQLWRPAQRSTSRYRAANALRLHGWDFALERGRYAGTDSLRTAEDGSPAGRRDEASEKRGILGFSHKREPEPSRASTDATESLSKIADLDVVNTFIDEVSRILRDAEAIDETAPEVAPVSEP